MDKLDLAEEGFEPVEAEAEGGKKEREEEGTREIVRVRFWRRSAPSPSPGGGGGGSVEVEVEVDGGGGGGIGSAGERERRGAGEEGDEEEA